MRWEEKKKLREKTSQRRERVWDLWKDFLNSFQSQRQRKLYLSSFSASTIFQPKTKYMSAQRNVINCRWELFHVSEGALNIRRRRRQRWHVSTWQCLRVVSQTLLTKDPEDGKYGEFCECSSSSPKEASQGVVIYVPRSLRSSLVCVSVFSIQKQPSIHW